MRARNRLTAIQIKNASDGKIEDGGGLRLVKKGESAKWVFRYSHLGRRREMGLGNMPTTNIATARKIRDKWESELAAGRDPITVRDAERRDEIAQRDRDNPTLEEFTMQVFEGRKAQLKGDGTAGRWLSPLSLYVFPKLGRKRISEIHQSDVHAAIKPIWQTMHPTAIKAMRRTKMVFEAAKLAGFDADPFTIDAALHMLGAVEHKTMHLAATDWQELPALYKRLSEHGSTGRCVQWHILTLVRSGAGRPARYDEINGDIWTVPASRVKGKRGKTQDFRVPLCTEALRLINTPTIVQSDNLWPGKRSANLSDRILSNLLRKMGEAGTVHGFRTSFRTWVQDTDACSFEVAETALGHSIGNTVERAYARSDLLDRRRLVAEAWGRFVTGHDMADTLPFPKAIR
jgi:integrase